MAVRQPVFKPYNQQQILAIPPTLEELIPKGHPVRTVNEIINKLDIEPLLKAYHIKGSSSYHPQLLLKVLVYGYVTNITQQWLACEIFARKVFFMWLGSLSYSGYYGDNYLLTSFVSTRSFYIIITTSIAISAQWASR